MFILGFVFLFFFFFTFLKVFLLCSINSLLFLLLNKQDAPEVVTRDTWMTELPPELQHIGLGARTFKKRSGPDNKDRSVWTDTPADRERKAKVVFKENKILNVILCCTGVHYLLAIL